LTTAAASPAKKTGFIDRAGLRGPYIKYWFAYVGVFYVAWLILAFGFGYWEPLKTRWPMAVVMTFGSVVAGATPMGGGTVAFPVLVLLFHQPPTLGRNFGLAIQALGMTSAMIFILCRRTPIQFRMLIWSSVGATAGLLAGTHPTVDQPGNGIAFVVLNVTAFLSNGDYSALITEMRDYMKSSPPAPGYEEVLLPGEADFRKKTQRLRDGIPVDERTWEDIRATGAALSVNALPSYA